MFKCEIKGAELKICPALGRFIDDKRLKFRQLFNMETFELSQEMVTLHAGEDKAARKRGTVINYCPFCGESIFDASEWRKEGNQADEGCL